MPTLASTVKSAPGVCTASPTRLLKPYWYPSSFEASGKFGPKPPSPWVLHLPNPGCVPRRLQEHGLSSEPLPRDFEVDGLAPFVGEVFGFRHMSTAARGCRKTPLSLSLALSRRCGVLIDCPLFPAALYSLTLGACVEALIHASVSMRVARRNEGHQKSNQPRKLGNKVL